MKSVCRADWLEKSQYPDIKSAGPSRWAWEFLRRNACYEADWQRHVGALRNIALRVPEISEYVEYLIADNAESWTKLKNRVKDEGAFNEQLCSWSFLLYQHVEWSTSTRALGALWGLENMVQPAHATFQAPRVMFIGRQFALGVSYPVLDLRFSKAMGSRDDWLAYCEKCVKDLGAKFPSNATERQAVSFDLRYPIKPQMDAAKRNLEYLQKQLQTAGTIKPLKAHKKQPREWLNYLRALDAVAVDARVDEIVSVLLPSEAASNNYQHGYAPRKKVEAWLDAGKKLMQEGYQSIALIPEKMPPRKEK